jgi:leader peptidase (prepilin peptidase)/N-methyltransferase
VTIFLFQALLALTLGAAIGSFLTVVAARLPVLVLEDHGLVVTARRALAALSWPGSHCDTCRTPVAWHDNIPLLSYLVLQGRCRACGASFPHSTWMLELLTAAAAVFCVAHSGWTAEALLLFLFLALLLLLAAIDLAEQLLPDVLVLPLALVGLVHAWLGESLLEAGASAAIAASLLWGIAAAFRIYTGREGMGLGDVKLAAALGLWLLPESLPFFFILAFAAGLVFQLPALLRRRVQGNTAIAFGPFLCGSAVLFVLFPEITPWLQTLLAGG